MSILAGEAVKLYIDPDTTNQVAGESQRVTIENLDLFIPPANSFWLANVPGIIVCDKSHSPGTYHTVETALAMASSGAISNVAHLFLVSDLSTASTNPVIFPSNSITVHIHLNGFTFTITDPSNSSTMGTTIINGPGSFNVSGDFINVRSGASVTLNSIKMIEGFRSLGNATYKIYDSVIGSYWGNSISHNVSGSLYLEIKRSTLLGSAYGINISDTTNPTIQIDSSYITDYYSTISWKNMSNSWVNNTEFVAVSGPNIPPIKRGNWSNIVNGKTYCAGRYRGVLTQSGTNDPVETILEDYLTPYQTYVDHVWSRMSTGIYELYCDIFPGDPTVGQLKVFVNGGGNSFGMVIGTDNGGMGTTAQIQTRTYTGVLADGVLHNTLVEVDASSIILP